MVLPLSAGSRFRLEGIVSFGAASAQGFWYDQGTLEWVALVRGTAELQFEDGACTLCAGDYLLIQAHVRHRVTRASDDAVWIAVHYDEEQEHPIFRTGMAQGCHLVL